MVSLTVGKSQSYLERDIEFLRSELPIGMKLQWKKSIRPRNCDLFDQSEKTEVVCLSV